ncbi:MAG: NAD(P)H-dependent oxidoreductase [Actinomycetota bacterium]
MTTVVVQAHPVPESLNAALCDRVEAGLDRAGSPYRVHRLATDPPPQPADLAVCEHLVLVYPTWWGGQPAQLLDWLHDTAGLDPADGAARPLAAVDRLTAVTSLGSSRLLNIMQGEWGRRHLRRNVLPVCAPSARFQWLALYKVDRRPREAVAAHLDVVEERFARG